MGIPKYKQAANDIVAYIRSNGLSTGSKLPGGRKLKEILGVSKTTVYEALQLLQEHGVIELREKSGCFVAEAAPEHMNNFNWSSYISKGWQKHQQKSSPIPPHQRNDVFNLCSIVANKNFGYYEYFAKVLDILRSDYERLNLLQNTDTLGSFSLRQLIAQRMNETHKIETSPERIIINNGIESSCDVFIRTLLSSGDTIYTEEPAAFPYFTLASAIGINVVTVPVDNQGLDVVALKRVFRKGKSMLLTTTFSQIPTGIHMSMERRREIFDFCTEVDIPIMEIDVQWFPDKKFLPIRALDKEGSRVIYSHGIFMPATIGMNIGYVEMPLNIIPKIQSALMQTAPYSFALNNRILEIFYETGLYDEFIRQLAPKLYRFRNKTEDLIQKYLSPYAYYESGGGKIVFWIRFHDNIDVEKLFRLNKNLVIIHGSFYHKKFSQYIFILPYALNETLLEQAFIRLSELIKHCIKN